MSTQTFEWAHIDQEEERAAEAARRLREAAEGVVWYARQTIDYKMRADRMQGWLIAAVAVGAVGWIIAFAR